MIRSLLEKVAWVGRTASMVFGLGLVLALVLGVATMALAAAPGDPFKLGKLNSINRISKLVGTTDNAMLLIDNNSDGANATALDLQVGAGRPPMRIDSGAPVANLNADNLDGRDASQFVPIGTTAFMRSGTYRAEGPEKQGTVLGDGTRVQSKSCPPGERLLSGGPANISESSDLLESFPSNTNTWHARINTNGVQDLWTVVVLCADQ